MSQSGNVVAFHPGAEVSVRHIVLGLAGPDAVAAADALGDVDQHAPPVLGHFVVGGGLRGAGEDESQAIAAAGSSISKWRRVMVIGLSPLSIVGTMRLVAGVASHSAGVVGGNYLRKVLWLGGVGLVTADAQHRGVDFRGLKRGGVVGMLGQWSVTGLARDMRVHALALHVEHIGVAAFTSLMAGEHHRFRGDVGNSRGPVVAVLSKGLGNKDPAQDQEQGDPHSEDRRHPKKVPCILKVCHRFDREYLVRLSICMPDDACPAESGKKTSPSLIKENVPSRCATRHI